MPPANRHRLNPLKLALTKWTAVAPVAGEKHFWVTRLSDDGAEVELTAVLTGRAQWLPWRTLRAATVWQMGWK